MACIATALQAAPVPVPGPADAGRINKREEFQSPDLPLSTSQPLLQILPSAEAPAGSDHVTMTLQRVQITGMHAYSTAQVKDIYAPYVGQKTTLDKLWVIAGALTERYRRDGYFLSHAIVPQQNVQDGVVTIDVIEGYVGDIVFDDPLAQNSIVTQFLSRLKSYRPLKTEQIESILLQLNDLPGVNLHAVLEPMETKEANIGSVRLMLERRDTPTVTGHVDLTNDGSRFLGPYQARMQAQAVLLPMQKTTLTLLSSLPWDEVRYGGIRQEIPVIAGGTVELSASNTKTAPGYTLTSREIRGDAVMLDVGFNYSLIRQRQENLTSRVAFETHTIDADILGTPLTRENIRVLRAGLTYGYIDGWNGTNTVNSTVSRGLDMFGASKAGRSNLSRAQATPDFTKIEASFNRSQALSQQWGVVTAASAQVASGPLYSSEEFGYGGQAFGRAYDDSEITGDHGVAASAELRYNGLDVGSNWQGVPYMFYDIGTVWNDDIDQPDRASGSSAGVGLRIFSHFGLTSNMALAFPLTRDIATPLHGSGKDPRYVVELSYGF